MVSKDNGGHYNKPHPGRGGYPFETKIEARRLWIQGKTDVEIAKELDMGDVQGPATVGRWRKKAEPDGQDWYVFRKQATTLALERAREEVSSDLAASIVAQVRTMHSLGDQLLNWLVWEVNDQILGPLNRWVGSKCGRVTQKSVQPQSGACRCGQEGCMLRQDRPRMKLDSTKDLRMVQAIVCDIMRQTDELAQPRAPRTMDAEQISAVADKMMRDIVNEVGADVAAVKVLEVARIGLASLPQSDGNGKQSPADIEGKGAPPE